MTVLLEVAVARAAAAALEGGALEEPSSFGSTTVGVDGDFWDE